MGSRLVVLLLSLACSLLVAEGVLRAGFAHRFRLPEDERSLTYRHDVTLGWFPEPGSERVIQGTRRFSVRHNRSGFRDREHGPKGRPRLAVLGDSFVWGFDVEQTERFTERLQERLPSWDVLNLGVSGYGTDQALLLLAREMEGVDPDVVVLVFAEENDREDNVTNRRYGPYYKPYFVREGPDLAVRGVPVPPSLPYLARRRPLLFESVLLRAATAAWLGSRHPTVSVPDPSHALVRAVAARARAHGARFALAVQGRGPSLAFAREEGIPVAALANRFRYPRFGGHWTPHGHAVVAARIHRLLEAQGWLEEPGSSGAD